MPLPSGLTPEVVTALQSAFSAHIDDAGPVLADDAHFLAAFSGYPGRFMTYGWLNTRKLAQVTVGSDALPATLAFYVDRFPGVAVLAGKDLRIARVLADDAGRQALNQVFGTPHRARELARRLPGKGGAFARLAVAPNTLVTGLDNLLPPSEAGAKGTVQHFSTMLPALLGVSLDTLSKALSGQFTLLATLPSMGPAGPMPDPDAQILAVGLVDGAAADALLEQILTANASAGRLTHDQFKLAGGEPARRFTLAGLPPVHLVRSEQTWLLGLSPKALEAALKQTGLESATVPTLEGEGFLAVGVDLPELIARMSGALSPGGAAPDLKGLLGDSAYAQFEIGLDPHGLALRNGQGLAVFVGITAAVAAPAFVKYVRRSKSAEARINVAQLAREVRAHLAGDQPTPLADTPLTPTDWTCDPDGYTATPERFAHPTFKTLQFEPQGTQRYRYAVRTLPDNKVEVRAEGDLDCDGTASVFRMEIHSGGASPLETENELE
jgi:type II secretory pathway pseudopilin PulG